MTLLTRPFKLLKINFEKLEERLHRLIINALLRLWKMPGSVYWDCVGRTEEGVKMDFEQACDEVGLTELYRSGPTKEPEAIAKWHIRAIDLLGTMPAETKNIFLKKFIEKLDTHILGIVGCFFESGKTLKESEEKLAEILIGFPDLKKEEYLKVFWPESFKNK
jgi:hypothetical protein